MLELTVSKLFILPPEKTKNRQTNKIQKYQSNIHSPKNKTKHKQKTQQPTNKPNKAQKHTPSKNNKSTQQQTTPPPQKKKN